LFSVGAIASRAIGADRHFPSLFAAASLTVAQPVETTDIMQIFKTRFFLLAAAVFGLGLAASPVACAQGTTASLHGHVNNAAGDPLTSGNVELTVSAADPKTLSSFAYTFPISATGDYTGKDIAPGDYQAYVVQGKEFVDRLPIKLVAGDDQTLSFDMTRAAYINAMTPEERKQLEEIKKHNAGANADNKVIANLNATLGEVRTDLKTPTPNFDKDVADMKQATDAKPEEGILWMTYGDALAGDADHMAAEDKKAGKQPLSDDAVNKEYTDATDAYKKGIDLNAASKKPSPADEATAYNQMGSTFAHAGKVQDAQNAYESAVKLVPANAGMYYGNEAAILYNASQNNSALGDSALAAANKAIEADPEKADPYFVKGQILLQKATVDPKTQKIVLPDGCEDAYQHYLSLAPNGKFAASVKEILAGLNIKINTSYKATNSRKKK
jgi:tetratricopeptide (TPR) repeat protein